MRQQERTVLITGASRGIGRALARSYAASGARVLAVARRFEAGSAVDGITEIAADLARADGIVRVAERVRNDGAPLDVLVNNAGVQHAIDLLADDPDEIARRALGEIALNLTAPILLTRALLPSLRTPGAAVVNLTSLLARQPKPSAPVYSATKAALCSFTRSLRLRLAPRGIAVIEAVPPLVDTAMTAGRGTRKLSPQRMAEAIREGVDARRGLVAPGMARPVLLLERVLPGPIGRVLARS